MLKDGQQHIVLEKSSSKNIVLPYSGGHRTNSRISGQQQRGNNNNSIEEPETGRGGWYSHRRTHHTSSRTPGTTTVRGGNSNTASACGDVSRFPFQTAAEVIYNDNNKSNPKLLSPSKERNVHYGGGGGNGNGSPPYDILPNSSVGLRRTRFEPPRRLGNATGTSGCGGGGGDGGGVYQQQNSSFRGSGSQGQQTSGDKVDGEGNSERDKLRAALQGAIVRIFFSLP